MNYEMKIAICDDEKTIRDYIEKCIHEVCPNTDVIQYPDASRIVVPDFDADVLFLDINHTCTYFSTSLDPPGSELSNIVGPSSRVATET